MKARNRHDRDLIFGTKLNRNCCKSASGFVELKSLPGLYPSSSKHNDLYWHRNVHAFTGKHFGAEIPHVVDKDKK